VRRGIAFFFQEASHGLPMNITMWSHPVAKTKAACRGRYEKSSLAGYRRGAVRDAKLQIYITVHVPIFVLIVALQALARSVQGLIMYGIDPRLRLRRVTILMADRVISRLLGAVGRYRICSGF
jgi:hypothetical protein